MAKPAHSGAIAVNARVKSLKSVSFSEYRDQPVGSASGAESSSVEVIFSSGT